ncbi:hypothetical protein Tco_0787810 [Tanacetum coccineum]
MNGVRGVTEHAQLQSNLKIKKRSKCVSLTVGAKKQWCSAWKEFFESKIEWGWEGYERKETRSSYARALIEVQAYVELKDNIMVVMPKLFGEGFYTCNVRVNYKWKPPKCTCCKVFGHVQDECSKNKVSDVVKNMKKPSQTHRGVPVGPKVGFKSTKQVYRHVSKKNNVNTSGNKKKDVEPTKEVSVVKLRMAYIRCRVVSSTDDAQSFMM